MALPVEGYPGMYRISVPRVADGVCQDLADAFGAVVVEKPAPCIDCAGDGNGVGRMLTNFIDAPIGEPFWRRRLGCPAGTVIGDDVTTAARRVKHEAIATDAGRLRFDHALHGAGGNRRVHGVAAGPENIDGGRRGQRMGCRRHAPRRHDGRSAG